VDGSKAGEKKLVPTLPRIGLQLALDGGCDSIEHGLEITDGADRADGKQGTWYCPPIAPYIR